MKKQYEIGQKLKVNKDFKAYDSEQQSITICSGDEYEVVYYVDYPETGCTYYKLYNADKKITVNLWNDEDGRRFVDEYFICN